MVLERITNELKHHDKSMPPVEQWNPPYCGEIDMHVKANGDWYYDGTLIKRVSLVKLFASVLIKEEAAEKDEYFLVTPIEKVKIVVDDAPFMLTQWTWLDEFKSVMSVSTNLGDEFILNEEHPVIVKDNGDIYVTVRRNLLAKVHRNVYYQWLDVASERVRGDITEVILTSDNNDFVLGVF